MAATLGLTAVLCASAVKLFHAVGQPHVLAAAQAFQEARLRPLLAAIGPLDSLTRETLELARLHDLHGKGPATIELVYADGEPAGLLLTARAEKGYAGPIRLLIGVRVDGTLSGIRVLEHSETPGLGDRIEPGKSDWLARFKGRSLADPDRAAWAIARDGGRFDQLTGASITSRAVVRALRDTLVYVDERLEALFAAATVDTDWSLNAITRMAATGRPTRGAHGPAGADTCPVRGEC